MWCFQGIIPFSLKLKGFQLPPTKACIFFDRLIAAFQYTSTVGFIMYLADSFGYLGSIGVLFFKEFGYTQLSWLRFFVSGGYVVSVVGTVLIVASMLYFYFKHKRWSTQLHP
ncbi:MAG: DUF5690 family protein [Flammeovirgaceae bacterium]